MNSRRQSLYFYVVSLAVSACAPASYQYRVVTEDVVDMTVRERRPDRIQSFELPAVTGATALDAVRQLRPEFLRSEPPRTLHSDATTPSVYLDARYAGGLEVLGTIPLTPVVEIQHLTSSAAKNVFGSYCKCDGGVILVRTRVEPRSGGPPPGLTVSKWPETR